MRKTPLLAAVWLAAFSSLHAEIRLPHVLASHMILQRETAVPIWGWAGPGETVTVTFAGQTCVANATADGRWQVQLTAMPANEDGRDLVVADQAGRVVLTDVLVGDVWLAGGQSNMGFPLNSAHNAAEVLPQARDPQLRFFSVARKPAAAPQSDCAGTWEATTPETAKNFSAVAYFFAREIRRDQHCPVGVLLAPWGGTDIETWISLAGLKQSPALTKTLDRWREAVVQAAKIQAHPELAAAYESDLKHWQAEVAPAYNAALKQYNADKAAGHEVGPKPQPARPEPSNPDPMGLPSPSRRPSTPTVNFNGLIAPLAPCALRGIIWYQGENNGSAGMAYRALFPRLIMDWREQWQSAGFAGGADLPFLFVQLPCNGADAVPVAQSGWPWLREAQLLTLGVPHTAMAITIDVGNPNDVHPADKIDVGVRLALAAKKLVYHESVIASGPLYEGFTVEANGQLRVCFSETGGGLVIGQAPWRAPGVPPLPLDQLIGFYLAGEDQHWVAASARIDGGCVVVRSPQVPHPVAVRYGWANSPRCNLYNQAGLPASPFRTDQWTDAQGRTN